MNDKETGAGKGCRYRPVNGDQYRENYDRIFGPKPLQHGNVQVQTSGGKEWAKKRGVDLDKSPPLKGTSRGRPG